MGTDTRTRNHSCLRPHPVWPGTAISCEYPDLLSRLSDVATDLEVAVRVGDLGAINNVAHDLRRAVVWLGDEIAATGG